MVVFAYPLVLIILLPIVLILLYMIFTNKDKIARVFDTQILAQIESGNGAMSKKTRDIVLAFAIICIVLALSRPLLIKDFQKYHTNPSVIVALDISHSMFSTDPFPSRVEFAKQKMIDMLSQANGINFSLVLFDEATYLVSPATNNYSVLIQKLQNLEIEFNTKNANYEELFDKSEHLFGSDEEKIMLLISDGEKQVDYDALAQIIDEKDLNLVVAGVGTQRGAPLIDSDNVPIRGQWSRFDPQVLKLSTNGKGVMLDNTSRSIEAIFGAIDSFGVKGVQGSYDHYDKIELFKPLLSLALLAIFISFFSLPRGIKAAFVVLFLWQPSGIYAFDHFNIQKAQNAYEKGAYEDAIKYYSLIQQSAQTHYNKANSYYKLQEYEKAIEEYSTIDSQNLELTHKKYHNIGNSYFKLQKYEDAVQYYEKALSIQEDTQTRQNLEMAKEALEKEKEQQQDAQGQESNKAQTQEDNTTEEKSTQQSAEETKDAQKIEQEGLANQYKKYERMLRKPKTQMIKIEDIH